MDLFLKDSFRGFVLCKQKSQITRFVLIRKDLYTNPASLLTCLPCLSCLTYQGKDLMFERVEAILQHCSLTSLACLSCLSCLTCLTVLNVLLVISVWPRLKFWIDLQASPEEILGDGGNLQDGQDGWVREIRNNDW
jgi:hypothetical protein